MKGSTVCLSLLTLFQFGFGVRTPTHIRQFFCQTPHRKSGSCTNLVYCPELVMILTQIPGNLSQRYIAEINDECKHLNDENVTYVCCADPKYDNHAWTDAVAGLITKKTYSTNDQDSCTSPNFESGFCRTFRDCTELYERLRRDRDDETYIDYLKKSHKICGSTEQKVCCPSNEWLTGILRQSDEIPRNLPTEDDGCGITEHDAWRKLVGAEDAEIGAWPWMALIGYDPYSTQPFRCGGALITSRHVLTAAHCLRSDLSFVRLGEHDLSIETETKHVDIDVIKSERHPDFGIDGRHDIAVLLLAKKVEFNEFITPICLPISNRLRAKSYIDTDPYVAGWGQMAEGYSARTSHILKQLHIPILNNTLCETIYMRHRRIKSAEQFDNSVLCGGYLVGGMDTCRGDSGGPLMIPELYKGRVRYYQIGLVAYGIGCARVGIPGVYTSTQHFIDWIANKIAQM